MPSYLSYMRQVMDADEEITWITVKGNHIPIKKGENKEDAIKSFFESKKSGEKSSQTSESKQSKATTPEKAKSASGVNSKPYKDMMARAKKSKENKSITVDSVLKDAVALGKFSEKDITTRANLAAKYSDARRERGNDGKLHQIDTLVKHTTGGHWEDGEYVGYTWKPERVKIQDAILDKQFAKWKSALPAKGEKPKLVILGGRGGSGKSQFTDGSLGEDSYDGNKFIVIDPDAYKEELPEYKELVDKGSEYGGLNAWEVHEESSDMKKMALKRALGLGVNVVLDGTLAKYNSTKKIIDQFKAAGYDIEGAYMHLPREKSAVRGVSRGMRVNPKTGKRSGRWVPIEMLIGMVDNEENFEKLMPYFSKWSIYDNDVPMGEKPKLVAKGGK